MNPVKGLSILILIGAVAFGCARYQKIQVLEGGFDRPYKAIGTLEVKEKAEMVPDVYRAGLELLSLGYIRYPDRADTYKETLNRQLARKAHDLYRADAVINVKYWPEPSSKDFPDGMIYARGQMIQLTQFPSSVSGPATTAANQPAAS